MKRVVQIFIEGQRVETFKDEEVKVSSTVQSIADLSKVFTDFSQSFTVPASPNNNEIFQHFYENDVDFQNGTYIDHNIRRDAVIEIDSTEFRRGKIQLEKANIKDGLPYSYQVTFYGLLASLKEIFGDNKLADLDHLLYTHKYEYAEIEDRITDGVTDYDIRYPLISGERYWQYNSTIPAENIDTSGGAILWTELFPAFKISKLLDVIESNYNISFEGNFLTDPKFTSAFQLYKNAINPSYTTPQVDCNFIDLYEYDTPTNTWTNLATEPNSYIITFGVNNPEIIIDLGANSIQFDYVQHQYDPLFPSTIVDTGQHQIRADINFSTTPLMTYFIDVYRNGVLYTTLTTVGNGSLTVVDVLNTNNASLLQDIYSFKVRSENASSFQIQFSYDYVINGTPLSMGFIPTYFIICNPITTLNWLDLSQFAPDIKVVDWFSDMLKLFNLTCYGIDETTYKIETVEDWYNQGDIFNITEYTDLKSIDIDRIKLWKRIEFAYTKSENILNRQFGTLFNREFGDLNAEYNFDGKEYKINVKFENILHNRFSGTNLQVGYGLKENLSPYVPKPVILYMYDEQTVSFYLSDNDPVSPTANLITNYLPFGQDTKILVTDYSLNWGAENSTLLDVPNLNGLYKTYYQGYIQNLYNPKNRITKLKARLPLSILTNLDLNDRLVIRDKRYIIDTMNTNLNTGVVDFTLYNDFRNMLADGGQIEEIDIGLDAQCLNIWVELPKAPCPIVAKVTQFTSIAGVTITPSTIYESQYVQICVPANPDGTGYISKDIVSGSETYITTESNSFLIEDQTGITQSIVISVQTQVNCTPPYSIVNYINLNQLGEAP